MRNQQAGCELFLCGLQGDPCASDGDGGGLGMPVGGGGVFGDLCGWVAVLGRTLSADLSGWKRLFQVNDFILIIQLLEGPRPLSECL